MGGITMSSDQERERLAKLREKQLQSRDPGPRVDVKWKGEKAIRREPWLKLLIKGLPPAARGAVVGMVFGILVSVAMGLLMPYPFGAVCGSIFFLVAIGVGAVVGNATDQGSLAD
jgi:hypothetical protein